MSLKDDDVRGSLRSFEGIPVFGLVELNIWGACNRSCEFCPISDPSIFVNKKEGITLENYKRVLIDLQHIGFDGSISWSMFSEPTLHKRILTLAAVTKEILPNVLLQLTSNGDTLRNKPDRLAALFDAGLDRINFSLYDGPDQFAEFTELRRRVGLTKTQVKLRRRYLEGGNYGITISNRTGLINANAYRDKNDSPIVTLPLKRSCYYPFYQVAIDYNGDVLLCPHDWGKKYIAGNAFETSIWDIWKGARFRIARDLLKKKSRTIDSCKSCDVAGHLIGEENFLAFSKTNSP